MCGVSQEQKEIHTCTRIFKTVSNNACFNWVWNLAEVGVLYQKKQQKDSRNNFFQMLVYCFSWILVLCYEPLLRGLIHINADHLGWLWCSVTQRERNLTWLWSVAVRAGPAGHFQMESFLVRNEIHCGSNFCWKIVLWHNLGPEDVSDLGWERLDSLRIAEFSPTVIVRSGWCFTHLWSRTLKFMTPSACFARSGCPTPPTDSQNLWGVG